MWGLPALAFAQHAKVSLDGNWVGSTSQGKSITLRIEAGLIRTLDLDWTMDFDQVCPGRTGSAAVPGRIDRGDIFYFQRHGSEPAPIQFPAFTLSREVETPQGSVTMTFAGSFAADSVVAGDLTLTAHGCPGRDTAKWKAARK
jgi:hypothetical protein